MKTFKRFLVVCLLLLAPVIQQISAQDYDPCQSCNQALVFTSHSLINTYRHDIGSIIPLVGPNSSSYIGGSFSDLINNGLNSMSWMVSSWEVVNQKPGSGTIGLSLSLLNASASYWSQMQELQVHFNGAMAALDRDYCNCLNQRGCANGCFF